MKRYEAFGGLRIKIPGHANKAEILNRIDEILTVLEKEGGVVEFSGINFYVHMRNGEGERVAMFKEGQLIDGIAANKSPDDKPFELKSVGLHMLTEAQWEKRQQAVDQARKEREQQRAEELAKERAIIEAHNAIVGKIGAMICGEFNVPKASHIASSIALIKDKKAKLKYLSESQIPESGIVYRASMRDKVGGATTHYRIYNENLELIASVSRDDLEKRGG